MTKAAQKLKILEGGKKSNKDVSHFYELLFENASDAMLVVDLENQMILNANESAQELTGYLKEELVGRKIELLIPQKNEVPQRSQALDQKHFEMNGFFEDVVLKGKDRIPRFISISTRKVEMKAQSVSVCIVRDIAEKKNMERDLITKHSELRNAFISLEKVNAELKSTQETLVQSGKLAALGELAAGIAHELNQPLTSIKGFAQEAVAWSKQNLNTEQNENLSIYLKEIVSGSDKMDKIISHLRNFTRKSTKDFQEVDVHQVIDESLIMLQKQFTNRGIKVQKNYDLEIPKIFCNPFQLEQVFINLATNARDAIESKKESHGLIVITTKKSQKEGMIEIDFKDNGMGMSEAVRSKVFNPFFTTKEVGKGMGLGLSISYGILNRINGSIVVESDSGQGSLFRILLPIDYRKH